MIVESSLKKTLRVISSNHGHNGRISGVVLRGNVFDQALTWLKAKEAENNDPKRKEYDLGNHNCMTFVADLAEHVGLDSPLRMRIVMPKAYMVQYQLSEVDIEYEFSNDLLEITE